MKITLLACVFAAISFTGCGGSSDTITFKFNPEKGTKYNYSVTTDVDATQSMMGQNMKINSKIVTAYTFEVIGDSAGYKNIKASITKMGMDMNANGMAMKFDSDSPNADTSGPMGKVGKIFGAIKGGEFYFTINDTGSVVKIYGIDEMVAKMLPTISGVDTAMAKQTLSQAFNEQTFKVSLQHSFSLYPGHPVKPGDSWHKTDEINMSNLPLRVDYTYTLESVTGDNVKIKVDGKLSSTGAAPVPGMQMDLTGAIKGINKFSLQNGLIVSGDDAISMDAKMHMQGQEVPMKMNEKLTIAGKKL